MRSAFKNHFLLASKFSVGSKKAMDKVIFGMTMSLDGFVNDKTGSVSKLYPSLEDLRNTEALQESIRTTGAVIMGRKAYEMANGDFTDYEYQVPIFVLTHNPPSKPAKGENDNLKFHFIRNGARNAVALAKASAAGKNVTVIGGPHTGRQLLEAELLDEIHIDIMPVLLGEGLRLFEHLNGSVDLEKIKVTQYLTRTAIRFQVINKNSNDEPIEAEVDALSAH
jgi:dihydrofolate reductase